MLDRTSKYNLTGPDYTFLPIEVKAVEPTHAPPVGGAVLTVKGVSFVPGARASVGGVWCTNTTFVNMQTLHCIVPVGFGVNLTVVVEAEDRSSEEVSHPQAALFTYDAPKVAHVYPNHGPKVARNKTLITVLGENFGPAEGMQVVFLGKHVCEDVQWFSDRALRCRAPHGAGRDLPVTVLVGGQQSAKVATAAYAYDRAVVQAATPLKGASRGHFLITLTGKNFGMGINEKSGIFAAQDKVRASVEEKEREADADVKNREWFQNRKAQEALHVKDREIEAEKDASKTGEAATEAAEAAKEGTVQGDERLRMLRKEAEEESAETAAVERATAAAAVEDAVSNADDAKDEIASKKVLSQLADERRLSEGGAENVGELIKAEDEREAAIIAEEDAVSAANATAEDVQAAQEAKLRRESAQRAANATKQARAAGFDAQDGNATGSKNATFDPDVDGGMPEGDDSADASTNGTNATNASDTGASLRFREKQEPWSTVSEGRAEIKEPKMVDSMMLSLAETERQAGSRGGASMEAEAGAAATMEAAQLVQEEQLAQLDEAVLMGNAAAAQAEKRHARRHALAEAAMRTAAKVDERLGRALATDLIVPDAAKPVTPLTVSGDLDLEAAPNGNGTALGNGTVLKVAEYADFDADTKGIAGTVTVGGRSCLTVTHVSDSTLECVAPILVGPINRIVVRVEGDEGRAAFMPTRARDGVTGAFVVVPFPPVVSGVMPNTGSSQGDTVIKVTGENFGEIAPVAPRKIEVFIGDQPCRAVLWKSDSVIECVTPPGFGGDWRVDVRLNGLASMAFGKFSYDVPVVTGFSPTRGPTAGGYPLRITGRNLGITKHANSTARQDERRPTIRLGDFACTNVTVQSSEQVTCMVPAGAGAGLDVVVRLGHQDNQGGWDGQWSYDTPVVEGVVPVHARADGGYEGTLMGRNFGPIGTAATVLVHGAKARNTTVLSDKMLRFVFPAGVGFNVSIIAAVGRQQSQPFRWFAYDRPIVEGVSPRIAAAGEIITVAAENLGPVENDVTVTVGGKPCKTVRRSNGAVSCETPDGVGFDRQVLATVGGQTSTPSATVPFDANGAHAARKNTSQHDGSTDDFSYSPPVVINMDGRHGPTVGGTPIFIEGEGFGDAATANRSQAYAASDDYDGLHVFVGDVECAKVTVKDANNLVCITPPGCGKDKPVVVKVGGQSSKVNVQFHTFSYDAPQVLTTFPRQISPAGGQVLNISGQSFGTPATCGMPNVTVNGRPCAVIGAHWTDSAVQCIAPAGAGADQAVVVRVGEQSSSSAAWSDTAEGAAPQATSHLIAYYAPIVDLVVPAVAEAGDTLMIIGDNFGGADPGFSENGTAESAAAAVGRPLVLLGPYRCLRPRWVNNTALTCVVPQGHGARRRVGVVVAGQVNKLRKRLFSYRAPQVDAVHPNRMPAGPRLPATAQGQASKNVSAGVVRIRGTGFGEGPASTIEVRIADQPCDELKYIDERTLECLPRSYFGKFWNVEVSVGNTASYANQLFSYDAPTVLRMHPANGKTCGGYPVVVEGNNFVGGAAKPEVSIGNCSCTNVEVLSATSLRCIAPAGAGRNQLVRVNIGGQASQSKAIFTYFVPKVTRVRPSHASTMGGTVVTIFGENLGGKQADFEGGNAQAQINGVPCSKTEFVSSTELRCTVPAVGDSDVAACADVSVTATGGQKSAKNMFFSYDLAPNQLPKGTAVKHLNADNFDAIVNGAVPVVVQFCAPWCPHCKRFKNSYEELAKLMQCKALVVATVDASKHAALAQRFGIEDFPRILWFPKGRTTPLTEYAGVLSAEHMIGWIARRMGVKTELGRPHVEEETAEEDVGGEFVDGRRMPNAAASLRFKRCKADGPKVHFQHLNSQGAN